AQAQYFYLIEAWNVHLTEDPDIWICLVIGAEKGRSREVKWQQFARCFPICHFLLFHPNVLLLLPSASQRQRRKKEVTWKNVGVLSKGIEFKGNSLVIKSPGQYFVYSQVVFYGSECQGRTVYLSHELARLSASYRTKTPLVKAMKTVCHNLTHGVPTAHGPATAGGPWYETIYQGAIFELAEGDQIFSRVSTDAARYVNTEGGMTYFGLFAL
ncbi:hypothetical protein chiPu_0023899, partial [Chiloscyllium punctatum]|nr:hypothetical protein [Chiloscyllium punctatum]